MRSRIPQRFVADNSRHRSHIRSDGVHVSVRPLGSQTCLSLHSVGSRGGRRCKRLRSQLSRVPCSAILHRSTPAGILKIIIPGNNGNNNIINKYDMYPKGLEKNLKKEGTTISVELLPKTALVGTAHIL